MAILYIMQFRQWQWGDELRLPGAAGESPDSLDLDALKNQAGTLTDCNISAVLSADGEAGQTAVAAVLPQLAGKVKTDTDSRLREMDFGLWQGLAIGEIRQRHVRAYKQWRESPATSAPPAGETFAVASERLLTGLNSAVRRTKGANMLFILSPMVAAVLHCRLFGKPVDAVWDSLVWDTPVRNYELDRISLVEELI